MDVDIEIWLNIFMETIRENEYTDDVVSIK